jgi:xanthine permease XanP
MIKPIAGEKSLPKRPPNLIYGVDDRPRFGTALMLGLQHVFAVSVAFVFPVVVVREIGGSPIEARNLITMAMIATAVGTILQGLRRGPVGSGYLAPHLNGPAFLSASLMAGRAGGLPLIFGMTMLAGAAESLFSTLVRKLRAVFPSEVTGTVVLMVGIEVIPIAIPRFLGIDESHRAPDGKALFVAFTTLAAMAALSVWGKGFLRLYSVILGMATGYGAAVANGTLGWQQLQVVLRSPIFAVPAIGRYGLSFDQSLAVPFIIAMLSSALKTMGDLTTCQKINDLEWRRPDMTSIGRGILACGIGNLVSGATGALGQSISSSNIGLSIATGAASRQVAYATGGILIVLAFLPKLADVFVIMPTPVMGAVLVFSVSFMILAGFSIITSRMIDARKTFVIGVSIIFGLSVDIMPGIYKSAHPGLEPLFSSSLAVATVIAILLNLLFRIGISRIATLGLAPGVDFSESIFQFMEKQGGLWGARRDVVQRAATAITELMEAVSLQEKPPERVEIRLRFDEFNLDVEASHEGPPVQIPQRRPDTTELLDRPQAAAELAMYLVQQYADRVTARQMGVKQLVTLHYEH